MNDLDLFLDLPLAAQLSAVLFVACSAGLLLALLGQLRVTEGPVVSDVMEGFAMSDQPDCGGHRVGVVKKAFGFRRWVSKGSGSLRRCVRVPGLRVFFSCQSGPTSAPDIPPSS